MKVVMTNKLNDNAPNMYIMKLPANTSGIIQPNDVGKHFCDGEKKFKELMSIEQNEAFSTFNDKNRDFIAMKKRLVNELRGDHTFKKYLSI